MEEQLKYYFYNYGVETATADIHGWQKLTPDEIQFYLTHNCDVVYDNSRYSLVLHTDPSFDLQQYKIERIKDLSALSLSVGEVIAPTYRFNNCLLSRDMEANGETPIYNNWEDVLNEYKNKRIALRNEFYRLKAVVENATTKEEIDNLFTINIFIL